MKDKFNLSPITVLLLSLGIFLYTLFSIFQQIKSDLFPRITTIIALLYAAFTFCVVFLGIIIDKQNQSKKR